MTQETKGRPASHFMPGGFYKSEKIKRKFAYKVHKIGEWENPKNGLRSFAAQPICGAHLNKKGNTVLRSSLDWKDVNCHRCLVRQLD